LVEQQTPNLMVGGSSPSWPAKGYVISENGWLMKNVAQFFYEVKSELSKVVWPRWNEFVGATIVVLVLMALFSLYLGVIDFWLSRMAGYVFKVYGLV
jgi:preprotein translocase subunit SecE